MNYELVREGYAKATPYKPDILCEGLFYDAQLQAQQAHLVCRAQVLRLETKIEVARGLMGRETRAWMAHEEVLRRHR